MTTLNAFVSAARKAGLRIDATKLGAKWVVYSTSAEYPGLNQKGATAFLQSFPSYRAAMKAIASAS